MLQCCQLTNYGPLIGRERLKYSWQTATITGIIACVCVISSLLIAMPATGAGQTININGSTALAPVLEDCITPYYSHTGNFLNVTGGGSISGVSGLLENSLDIAMISCEPDLLMTPANAASCLDWKIGKDMVCLVVNDGLGVTNITLDEIKQIWEAGAAATDITWGDLRPEWPDDIHAVPISRATTSGTRAALMDVCNISESLETATQSAIGGSWVTGHTFPRQDSVEDVADLIANDHYLGSHDLGLIGYVSLYYAYNTPGLQILAVDDGSGPITPAENGSNFSTYCLSRYLHLLTRLPRYDSTYRLFTLDCVYWMLDPSGQDILDDYYLPVESGVNPTPYWDVNGDGKCTIGDAVKLGLVWQVRLDYPGQIPEDITGDAKVTISDAVAIGQNWQKRYYW